MKTFLLALGLLLVIGYLRCEEAWHGAGPQGSRIHIEVSHLPVEVDNKVQIQVTLVAPRGYQVDKNRMRNQLLDYIGFGPSPITLMSEETAIIDEVTTKITYTLDPEIAGDHLLTFGQIIFNPPENSQSAPIKMMTGVFSIPVILKTEMISYQGVPAELLPLSMNLPVDLSEANRETFINNEIIEEKLLKQSQNLAKHGWRDIFIFTICLLIVLTAILSIYRNKIKSPTAEEMRKYAALSAKDHAIHLLEALKNERFTKNGSYEAYFNNLTNVVRNYLEEAYGIRASRLTTIEFLQYAATHSFLDADVKITVQEFLQKADRIKFAQAGSSSKECELALNQALHIVNNTYAERDSNP